MVLAEILIGEGVDESISLAILESAKLSEMGEKDDKPATLSPVLCEDRNAGTMTRLRGKFSPSSDKSYVLVLLALCCHRLAKAYQWGAGQGGRAVW
jgi:hypothetical protein